MNPNASESAQSGRMAIMLILETGETHHPHRRVRHAVPACDVHLPVLLQEVTPLKSHSMVLAYYIVLLVVCHHCSTAQDWGEFDSHAARDGPGWCLMTVLVLMLVLVLMHTQASVLVQSLPSC